MDTHAQESWNSISRFYDDENNFSDDTDMFLTMAKGVRGEILELGSGTGRILIPFAKAGHKITGLDFSEPMLEVARKKAEQMPKKSMNRISLYCGDMTEFTIDRKFAFAIIAFNTLLAVVGFRKQQAVLRNVWGHLKPGGKLVLSVINPDMNLFSERIPYVKHAGSWIDSATGRNVDCFEFDYFDLANQIVYGTKLYDEIDENGIVHRTKQNYEMRYFFSYELQLLLEEIGFQLLNLYGDYTMKQFDRHSPYIIYECKKPR